MKALLALSILMLLPAWGQEKQTASSPAPQAECPLCHVPNRAALLAGLAQKCPEDCSKLCCTGEEATYVVEGLICENCTSKVSAALARLEGVHVEAVCYNTGQARVKYDPDRVDEPKIVAAIVAAGHKLTGRKVSFVLPEMDTEKDAKALETALALTDGITRITTTIDDGGQVTVVFDPATCTGARVEEAIAAAGYKVAPGS